ncbi:MAG: SpoIVB peptidase [Clostridiales bacterium]|jgi:stage IV sporulation protein B|nr:SpoIVB peptidase [Clostridiales bacterium]
MWYNIFKFGKRALKNIFLLLLCFSMAYFITSIIVFPENIKLIEGEKQYFHFRLPIEATIEPDTVSALKINNKPVRGNLKINLYENTELLAEESGTANMTLNAFGIDVKDVKLDFLPDDELNVIPCGSTIGVEIKTDGILVLATDYLTNIDGKNVCPAENILQTGDAILKINGKDLVDQTDLKDEIENSTGEVSLEIKRGPEISHIKIIPETAKKDGKRKIGVHVRDKTKGIGTLTYYHPESRVFGALGHGIVDIDTKQIMDIKDGNIYRARIGDIIKGKKGAPGELSGKIIDNESIGSIKKNDPLGIYGIIDENDVSYFNAEKKKIGLQNDIHEGPAKVLTNVEDEIVKEYDIYIDSVNKYTKDDSKGMVIRITDPELLSKTNGIVQGMSGSPILQDEKVIGAVTHVFVQDPTKGYGIFIENMLKQEL